MSWSNLPPFVQRSFLDSQADCTQVDVLKIYYDRLEKAVIKDSEDLEKWLKQRSELESAIAQASAVLYIQMTCHTDDEKKAKAYSDFIEHVAPFLKTRQDALNQKFWEWQKQFPLKSDYFDLYIKSIKTDIEIFRPENIPLQTKVELLSQEYQKITGSMTVHFRGEECTMPQMAKFQLSTDRALRQEAWEASAKRRLEEKDKLDILFNDMMALRHEMALKAGYRTFTDYQFKMYHRFDYTPSDCKKYHESIEKTIVPLYGQMLKVRQKEMGLTQLRPWDLAVDPLSRQALQPFVKVDGLIKGVGTMMNRLDKDLGKYFQWMVDKGLLDLESRKGKAPGGYQQTLAESRLPFIFMNAVGVDDDVRTLLHEAGHAFHALMAREQSLYDYRHAPMEFCEVASMSMELLAGENLSDFYSKVDARRSYREHLEGIIHTLAWVATIDAYQHWLYEHPKHSIDERRQAWRGFYQQYGGDFVDWNGLEGVRDYLWHRQLHVFEVPFYYIEYGIAQLGALQLWLQSKKNFNQALTLYKTGLSLGGSKPLPQLFQAAGLRFDFSEQTIKPLADKVMEEWQSTLS